MNLEQWIEQGWQTHGNDPAAVAARLEPEALPLLLACSAEAAEAHVAALARLAHHVLGSHLAQWQPGLRLLERLAALPCCGGDNATLLARLRASLALAAGEPGARVALPVDERSAALALAAQVLAEHDAARAAQCLRQAVGEVEAVRLPDGHPAVRALAVAGNNAAANLQDKAGRSEAETGLMLEAAAVGRRFWARAGSWLELQRAEYRLATCHAAAGNGAPARKHARECLRIVAANGNVPLEAFFGQEALALAEQAAGDTAARAAAVQAAALLFAQLEEGDRAWCQATLDRLRAP